MTLILHDLRFGFRMLVKNPAFTAMAVLSLALGIGANAAIFSLLDAILLKQLPVKQPQELFFIQYGEPGFKPTSNVSFTAFEQLKTHESISDACFFNYTTRVNVSTAGSSEVVEGQVVSGGFFKTLGVNPIAGRVILDSDDDENSASVVVLSDRYWERHFGRASFIGHQLTLNNVPFTIVGVTPPEFFGAIVGNAPDLYLPSITGERIIPGRSRFRASSLPFVLARLKPGNALQQAAAPLTLLLQRATLNGGTSLTEERQEIQQRNVSMLPASQGFNALRQQYSKPLRLLMAGVVLVLLITCANVANLMLTRATSRRREIALRFAMGANRFRIIRQLLTEGLLIALIGGAVGLLIASWGSRFLFTIFSSGRNPITAGAALSVDLPVDGRILLFTLGVSLAALLIFGLAPALRATRFDLSSTLKDTRHVASLKAFYLRQHPGHRTDSDVAYLTCWRRFVCSKPRETSRD
jgi:predicted permease